MPDARAGEAVDDAHAQLLRRAGRVLQLLGGAAIDAGRIAVAPHVWRQNRLVPRVDRVEHGLADQVRADGVHLQVVALQQVAAVGAVAVVGQRLVDLEMVAPAGQLQPLIAELAGLAGHVLQRQIGPLAGEQRDRSSHVWLLRWVETATCRGRSAKRHFDVLASSVNSAGFGRPAGYCRTFEPRLLKPLPCGLPQE